MEPNQTQPQIDPSKAGANLGFVNTLQEHLLQYKASQQQPQTNQPTAPDITPQTPQVATQPTQTPEPAPTPSQPNEDLQGLEQRLTEKIDALGASIKQDEAQEMKAEMKEIKSALKDMALKDDNEDKKAKN